MWKQPKCPPSQRTSKMWSIHAVGYHSIFKKKENPKYAVCVIHSLENIILGDINQIQKDKYCVIPVLRSLVAQMVKNLPETWETCGRPGLDPWVGKRARQPTPVSSPGESHGQRSLAGCSSWGQKGSGITHTTRASCRGWERGLQSECPMILFRKSKFWS